MKQEDRYLLLKDLSARLPYGVKCDFMGNTMEVFSIVKAGTDDYNVNHYYVKNCKPYLRPISSMTAEERKKYKHLIAFSDSLNGVANLVDWLNKKMFAYHTIDGKDMFELGLALEAPEGMYKTE